MTWPPERNHNSFITHFSFTIFFLHKVLPNGEFQYLCKSIVKQVCLEEKKINNYCIFNKAKMNVTGHTQCVSHCYMANLGSISNLDLISHCSKNSEPWRGMWNWVSLPWNIKNYIADFVVEDSYAFNYSRYIMT